MYEFTDPSQSSALRWSIGNALAVVAGPCDAKGVRSALRDPRWGTARQMLCDALVRTKDPEGPDVLLLLLNDDDVAGHAISALRRTGAGRAALRSPAGLAQLSAVVERATATEYAKRAAKKALRQAAAVA